MNAIPFIAKDLGRTLRRNSPAILTGIGVAGVFSTAVLAVKATWQARHHIEEVLENEDFHTLNKPRQATVMAKETWRFYVPAVGSGAVAAIAVVGSQALNSRRQAALISGIAVIDRSLREYREKTTELFGEKGHEQIQDGIAADRVAAQPPTDADLAMIKHGDVLSFDMYTSRYFSSSMEQIRRAQNDINASIINGDNYASLNEFYTLIGLDTAQVGEDVGWSLENLVDINFNSKLTEQGVPVLTIAFRAMPAQDYYTFH